MSRLGSLGHVLFACITALMPLAAAGQTTLPVSRLYPSSTDTSANVYFGSDIHSYYDRYLDFDGYGETDEHYSEAFEITRLFEDPDFDGNYVSFKGSAFGYLYEPTLTDPGQFGAAVVSVLQSGTAVATSSSPYFYEWIRGYAALDAQAFIGVEVLNDPGNSSLGEEWDSATLSGNLFIQTIVVSVSGTPEIGTNPPPYAYIGIGNSYLTVSQLDAFGGVWSVEGIVQQASSADPTAAPLVVDEIYYGGVEGEFWYPSEATNVGRTVYAGGSLYTGEAVGAATNYQYPEWYYSETEIETIWIEAETFGTVTVP